MEAIYLIVEAAVLFQLHHLAVVGHQQQARVIMAEMDLTALEGLAVLRHKMEAQVLQNYHF